MNPFDFGYVFYAPNDMGVYAWTYFGIATVGTIISNYLYFSGKYRFKNNLLTYTLVNRASRNAAIAFTLAFVFFLCRFSNLPPFNARLFLDITLIMLVYFIVRGVGYMLRTYPKAKAEWQTIQDRNQRKSEPRPAAVIRPAVSANNLAASSADAGGSSDEKVEALPAQPVRQGLSERGLKRRERKRNKR